MRPNVACSGSSRCSHRSLPTATACSGALQTRNCPLGATACYRALLLAILGRAYARAYGHAASYLGKLRRLAGELPQQHGLEPHASFEGVLRAKHPRKTAFWSKVAAS